MSGLHPHSPSSPAIDRARVSRPPEGIGSPLLAGLLAVLLCAPIPARTQVPAEPTLEGRVERSGEPLDQGTVVLHRVAGQEGGPVDSVALGPRGRFRFDLPEVPRPSDGPVYFASIRHQGVFYFGSAVNRAVQLDSLYRIQVYDTVSAPAEGAPFPVTARNILVEDLEGSWRAVDLIQIRNEGDRTVVAPEGGVIWRYPLPPEAEEFQVGRSDLAPDAVTFEEGSIRVSAPVPPGERTYMVRYNLPEPDFTVPMPGTTEVFELLVREPASEFSVSGATPVEPVEIEPGSSYRRFNAAGVRNHVVEVVRGEEAGSVPVAWLAVGLALVLAVAGIVAMRRSPTAAVPRRIEDGARREEVLLQIAELDEAHRHIQDPSPDQEQSYRKERSRLKALLRHAE